MKKFTAIIFCLVFIGGVSFAKSVPAEKKERLESLSWDTSGGGECKFTVVKKGAAYQIAVTSWSFKGIQKNLLVKKTDKSVYHLLEKIFSQGISLQEDVLVPQKDVTTGTWTKISLKLAGGKTLDFSDINTRGAHQLKLIYDFVKKRL